MGKKSPIVIAEHFLICFLTLQVDLLINGERWSGSKPNQQLEVRVSSENFDTALAKMASVCLPKTIFQGIAAKKSSDLGKLETFLPIDHRSAAVQIFHIICFYIGHHSRSTPMSISWRILGG